MSVLSAVMFGKWTDHVKSWRHTALQDRIMFIAYEEMVEVKASVEILIHRGHSNPEGVEAGATGLCLEDVSPVDSELSMCC